MKYPLKPSCGIEVAKVPPQVPYQTTKPEEYPVPKKKKGDAKKKECEKDGGHHEGKG